MFRPTLRPPASAAPRLAASMIPGPPRAPFVGVDEVRIVVGERRCLHLALLGGVRPFGGRRPSTLTKSAPRVRHSPPMRTPTRVFAWLLPALAAGLCASAAAPDLPRIDAATTLLVVSPHPDDETLCCAGVIGRVLQAGGRASVVWITSGDASRLTLMLSERSVF